MKVRWLAIAKADARRALRNTRDKWPGSVKGLSTAIAHVVERVREHPQSGRSGEIVGTRELVLTRYPFTLVYEATFDEVRILRLLHQSQQWSESDVR